MADRYSYLPLIGFVIGCVFWTNEAVVPATVGLKQLFGALPWRTDKQPSTSAPARPRTEHREGGGYTLKNWGALVLGCFILVTLICLTRRQLGYWQNTVTLFEHAIAVTADNPSAQFAMGVGLEREGEVRKAAVHYRVAVAIDPNYSKAYYNLGQILRKTGQWPQAADAYLAVVRLNPTDLATHLNLASVLAHLGRTREAVLHFNEALRLDPASIEALNNLAWLLATCPTPGVRDGARAVELAERACSLTDSKAAILLGTLAAAYAEAGRFLDAVATAQRACAQATATGDADTAKKNHELLHLYLANRPYRCDP
jgi:cytochrome c-type biogenesis protein CcmH/NrfG